MERPADMRYRRIVFGATALISFVIILLCTQFCPYLSDDWHFFFIWDGFDPTAQSRRISSFADIILSMKNYYHYSGGRVIAHFLAYCFLCLPKIVFSLFNGIIFAAAGWLLYRICKAISGSGSIWLYPLTALMSFCFIPSFGDDVIWLSGAVNYIWMTVPFLGCICWLLTRPEKAKAAEKIAVIPMFMLSAATNETTGGMLAAAIVLSAFCYDKRVRGSLIACLISIIPGMCLVLLAPGNTNRRAVVETKEMSLSGTFSSLKDYLAHIDRADGILLLIILVSLILVLLDKNISRKKKLHSLLPFILSLIGAAGLSLTGFFTARPMIFSFLLLIPASLSAAIYLYRVCRNPQNYSFRSVCRLIAAVLLAHGIDFLLFCLSDDIISIVRDIIFLLAALFFFRIRLPEQKIEKAEVLLQKLRLRLLRILRAAALVMALILTAILGNNLIRYHQWVNEYRETEQKRIGMIQQNELAKTKFLYMPQSRSVFTPVESSLVHFWYPVEWMAVYYGQDPTEFVEEFSETYPLFLKILES